MILGGVQSLLEDGEVCRICVGGSVQSHPLEKLYTSWGDKIKLAVKGIDL